MPAARASRLNRGAAVWASGCLGACVTIHLRHSYLRVEAVGVAARECIPGARAPEEVSVSAVQTPIFARREQRESS